MKIIDIFNLIANEEYEKLPKKIKFREDIFKITETCNNYYNEYNNFIGDLFELDYMLNDEVEIIEEPGIKEMEQDEFEDYLSYARDCILMKKLNEVIRRINEMGKSD